eukprot:1145159-Pelagomonas_calceolata.AAC.5
MQHTYPLLPFPPQGPCQSSLECHTLPLNTLEASPFPPYATLNGGMHTLTFSTDMIPAAATRESVSVDLPAGRKALCVDV